MLDWDEGEAIAAFEAAPEVDEDRTEYTFATEAAGATVRLVVWPYHCEIAITIRTVDASSPPVFDSGSVKCDRLTRRRSEGAEALEAWHGGRAVLVIKLRPHLQVALAAV